MFILFFVVCILRTNQKVSPKKIKQKNVKLNFKYNKNLKTLSNKKWYIKSQESKIIYLVASEGRLLKLSWDCVRCLTNVLVTVTISPLTELEVVLSGSCFFLWFQFKHSASPSNQSVTWLLLHMEGKGNSEVVIDRWLSCFSSISLRPSTENL